MWMWLYWPSKWEQITMLYDNHDPFLSCNMTVTETEGTRGPSQYKDIMVLNWSNIFWYCISHSTHKDWIYWSDFKHPYRWVNANRCNHIANALELHLSGNKPSIYQPHRCTMRCLLWNFREKWPHYNDAWLDNIQLAYSWRVLSNILLLWWCTILI